MSLVEAVHRSRRYPGRVTTIEPPRPVATSEEATLTMETVRRHGLDGLRSRLLAGRYGALTARLEDLDYASGFGAVWELIRHTNSYIEDQQPWALHKAGDTAAVAAVLGDCLEALRIVALLASPLIPNAAAELWRRLGLAGTPDEVVAKIGRFAAAGATRLYLQVLDLTDLDHLRLVARDVMPHV